MAISKIQYSKTLEHGGYLNGSLTSLEVGIDRLVKALGSMTLMIDGDGSNSSQFAEVVSRYGVEGVDDAARLVNAKAMWDELNSLKFKLTTDGTVDHVDAARIQAINKLR